MTGSCEHGNVPSDSIKYGEFPDHLRDCQLLRRNLLHEVKVGTILPSTVKGI
jgi:hypothetical protein